MRLRPKQKLELINAMSKIFPSCDLGKISIVIDEAGDIETFLRDEAYDSGLWDDDGVECFFF
jgi:hypothetical protein